MRCSSWVGAEPWLFPSLQDESEMCTMWPSCKACNQCTFERFRLSFVHNPLLSLLKVSSPLESCVYITNIKGRSNEAHRSPLNWQHDWIKCEFLIVSGLVCSRHESPTPEPEGVRLFVLGPPVWSVRAGCHSLCVFYKWSREVALGWVQAVCLCAHCGLSARGGLALCVLISEFNAIMPAGTASLPPSTRHTFSCFPTLVGPAYAPACHVRQ